MQKSGAEGLSDGELQKKVYPYTNISIKVATCTSYSIYTQWDCGLLPQIRYKLHLGLATIHLVVATC